MIVDIILGLLLSLVNFMVGLLPVGQMSPSIASGMHTIIGYMYLVNGFFPIDTLVTLAGVAIALEIGIMLWNFANFIFRYIRGD